jgi:hypothetical protein
MESGSVQDRSATLIGVVVMLLIITTVVVVLRLWTRYVILNQLGTDDFLALISLVHEPSFKLYQAEANSDIQQLVVIGCGIAIILRMFYL